MRLAGKKALITGAGSGIGRGMALLFAQNGAVVGVNDINPTRIEETIALVEAEGGKAVGVPFDVTNFDAVSSGVNQAREALGGLDIFCANAGIAPSADFVDISPEAWDTMMKVHLYGVFNGCKAVLPGMLEQSWGRIIVTSSMSAVSGDKHLTHYSAAKAGQVGFIRALAREVADAGVTVNAIAPGLVQTNILGEVDSEVIERYLPPVGRIGQPKDQAYAALYLASDEAEFVTGHLLQVNGGSF